jgi:hypothetical protein
MSSVKNLRDVRNPIWLIISAILGSGSGYIIYNTGLVFGIFKANQIGVLGCLQSVGTIGCGDTVNGLIYSILGGIAVGSLLYIFRRQV